MHLHVIVVRKGLGSTCGWQLVRLSSCWVLQGTWWSVTQKARSWVRQRSTFCSCSGSSGCSAPQISVQHPACCRCFRSLELYCEALWLSSWHTFPCERVNAALLFPPCSPPLFPPATFPFPVFLKLAKMAQRRTPKSVSLFWQFIVMA